MTQPERPVSERDAAPPPDVSWLPPLAAIPREGDDDAAKATASLTATLLGKVEEVAAFAIFAPHFDAVTALRQRVATVADVVIRRDLSKRASLDAEAMKRWTERAVGVALLDAGLSGRDAVKVAGSGAERYLAYAAVSAEEFRAAIEAGAVLPGPLEAALAAGEAGRPEPEPEPEPVAPEPTAVDMDRLLPSAIATLGGVAAAVEAIRPGDIAAVEPEAAADWATALWKVLVPIMAARRDLMARGN